MKEELKKRILSSVILIFIISFIIIKGSIFFNLFLIICLSVILYEWYKMSKKKNYYYLGIIFLFFSFYTIYKIYNYENNYLNFLFVLLICISSDIGGYVFGKLFKGPKLTSISPNKTFSGLIGGFLVSFLSISLFLKLSFSYTDETNILFASYIMILIISFISQLGDILVSYFKRSSNIKDTGNLIPGHGGLLDRADGMIFAFPFTYIILLTGFKLF